MTAKRAEKQRAASVPPALAAAGLTKRYGDLVALAPLDLSIPAGQRVALVGVNGSGKTTLLRLAAGLLDKTEGSIDVHGHAAGSMPARAELSYIPDDPVLYDDLSVREHLAYLAPLAGELSPGRPSSDALLGRLGIAHRADDLPSRFSRGLRQKTSLAVGLGRPYSVLLVDEPFVGLDESGRRALLALFDEATSDGATVIVASHQLELVAEADRCIALREGAVTYDGPAAAADLEALLDG